jgi:hypothetical protein
MPPKPFYEIAEKNHIFKNKTRNIQRGRRTPEENVRQWVLFELLSTYGFSINNLDVEVSVGQKYSQSNYRADIVVKRDGSPYIIIECKKQGTQVKPEKGLKQAQDYAENLGATFVVFADNRLDDWVVRRRWHGEWVHVCDIEKNADIAETDSITSSTSLLNSLEPILAWIYESVPATEAPQYFDSLQKFFVLGTQWGLDYDLTWGLATLLPILGTHNKIGKQEFTVDEYEEKNMVAAFRFLNSYLEKQRLIEKSNRFEGEFDDLWRQLLTEFFEVSQTHKGIKHIDSLTIRLITALLQYLSDVREQEHYRDIKYSTMREIENVLEWVLVKNLNRTLPDPLDTQDVISLQVRCKETWSRRKLKTQS